MTCLRTKPIEEQYIEYRKHANIEAQCPLCAHEPLKTFTYWKLVANDFPYDKIAQTHHMIVPLRHAIEAEFTPAEVEELRYIKHEIMVLPEYDFVMEITEPGKTIPKHFHLHVIRLRDDI